MTFEHKYKGEDIWMCFRFKGAVYIYPYDELLAIALKRTNIGNTVLWRKVDGRYSFPAPSRALQEAMAPYCLGKEAEA